MGGLLVPGKEVSEREDYIHLVGAVLHRLAAFERLDLGKTLGRGEASGHSGHMQGRILPAPGHNMGEIGIYAYRSGQRIAREGIRYAVRLLHKGLDRLLGIIGPQSSEVHKREAGLEYLGRTGIGQVRRNRLDIGGYPFSGRDIAVFLQILHRNY